MARDKSKGAKGVPNKHLHARVSFLQQAATYLALQGPADSMTQELNAPHDEAMAPVTTGQNQIASPDLYARKTAKTMQGKGLPFYLTSQLRQTAQKSMIRLDSSVKHASCKVCNAVYLDGRTCQRVLENLSKTRNKAHADVLRIHCFTCNAERRFPVGAVKQTRKCHRFGKKEAPSR